jgi:hypothetical protein
LGDRVLHYNQSSTRERLSWKAIAQWIFSLGTWLCTSYVTNESVKSLSC